MFNQYRVPIGNPPISGSNQHPPLAAKLASKVKNKGRKSRQLTTTKMAGKTISPRSPSCKRRNSKSPGGTKSTKSPKQANVSKTSVCTSVSKNVKENDNVS